MLKAHIRLKIEIEIGLKFNQSKERKLSRPNEKFWTKPIK